MSCVMDPRRIEDVYTEYEAKWRLAILEDGEIQREKQQHKNIITQWLDNHNCPHIARTLKRCGECAGNIDIGAKYVRQYSYRVNDFGQILYLQQYRHYPNCPTEDSHQ